MKLHHDVDATTIKRKTKAVAIAAVVIAAAAAPAVPHVTAKARHDTCWGGVCRPANTR